MPQVHLNDRVVDGLPYSTKQTDYWDASLPGFLVRVGAKSKTFQFFAGTPRKRRTLGRYPYMSLKEARQRAHNLIAAKYDPTPTVATRDAVQAYLRLLRLRPRTSQEYERLLGRLTLTGPLKRHSAHSLLTEIEQFADRPAEARHIFFAASAFFTWCVERSYLLANPLSAVTCPYKATSRDRVLSDAELKAIWHAADGTFGCIVRLLMLSGQRRAEIGSIRKEWIADAALIIPASIAKNRQENTIPLTPQMLLLAKEIATLRNPNNTWSKPKAALDKISGVTDWTLHDLRRTFSTNHAKLGTAPHVTEALLNHITGTLSPIAKIYNRWTYWPEKQAAMQAYDTHISHLIAD